MHPHARTHTHAHTHACTLLPCTCLSPGSIPHTWVGMTWTDTHINCSISPAVQPVLLPATRKALTSTRSFPWMAPELMQHLTTSYVSVPADSALVCWHGKCGRERNHGLVSLKDVWRVVVREGQRLPIQETTSPLS